MNPRPTELGAREPPRGDLVRALFSWLVDQFAAAIVRRMREAEAQNDDRDPDWGMVTQKTLPSWIHPDAFIEACRDGKVEGARSYRRLWIAPRPAVMAWWLDVSRVPGPANDVVPAAAPPPAPRSADTSAVREVDPESAEALLLAAGFDLSAVPPHLR